MRLASTLRARRCKRVAAVKPSRMRGDTASQIARVSEDDLGNPFVCWLSRYSGVSFFKRRAARGRTSAQRGMSGLKKNRAKLLTQKICMASFRRNTSHFTTSASNEPPYASRIRRTRLSGKQPGRAAQHPPSLCVKTLSCHQRAPGLCLGCRWRRTSRCSPTAARGEPDPCRRRRRRDGVAAASAPRSWFCHRVSVSRAKYH